VREKLCIWAGDVIDNRRAREIKDLVHHSVYNAPACLAFFHVFANLQCGPSQQKIDSLACCLCLRGYKQLIVQGNCVDQGPKYWALICQPVIENVSSILRRRSTLSWKRSKARARFMPVILSTSHSACLRNRCLRWLYFCS